LLHFKLTGTETMDELIKAGELSSRYGVSTRTLRYYEEIGLLRSRRTQDYAYRMYDEAAVKRLEQILILRKLGVGIKDIQRILDTAGTEVVLEVLGKKVDDIDEEVALLRELKEIVIAFIRQIRDADFSRDSDVKLLYEKARDIESQLASADYSGNPSPVHRLIEVTEKLEAKAVSRLQIPDNVLKRLLENVYFIWGSNEGIAVADELGRRYGFYVYHTCQHRQKHSQHADPAFQPGLCSFQENDVGFWTLSPEEAMEKERQVVHDFTPMVIMDLIQLAAQYEGVICENDIDIESIVQVVTHAVRFSTNGSYNNKDGFLDWYKNETRKRSDISEEENERYIRSVWPAIESVKGEIPGETTQYGVKHILWDDASTLEQTTDVVAAYFGLPYRPHSHSSLAG